jgi:hypothetical protein
MGTEGLLIGCRMAVSQEREPLRIIERCIDVHLRNARDLGHLVWVLGGEAQHQDSALYARRIEVHAALATLFAGADPASVDPFVYRTLILAIEGVARLMLEACDEGRKVTPAAVERTRAVMMRIATATVAGAGPGVTPLPPPPPDLAP